ncbi:MAG: putative lipid II flippase FtsW [Actinomycetota bacterium]|nr:putative lipid II flippase FtsW [Actinomycetota bacterium]
MRAGRAAIAPKQATAGKRASAKSKAATPIEYSMLLTTTLCLLALGVVMVFSASSTTSLLGDSGDGAFYLKRTALFGIFGLLAMRILAVGGVKVLRPLTLPLMCLSVLLLVAVMIPGVGVEVNGAKRWIGAGLFQIQPSEIAKVALILYGAQLLATRPKMTRSISDMGPFLMAVGLISFLVVMEPDLGTAMVACFAAASMLVAAGARMRDLGILAAAIGAVIMLAILIEPYRMERLTGFLNPGADPSGSGFQANQAQIALGSGGLFGVGLGESLQKAFYLPEAHTDMIAAVVGEELGLMGIAMIVGLFGLFGYAGLQTAKKARDAYTKLLAAGLTSLIVIQAVINLFAVLGLAPLTGVPLPFVSYGNSSLLTLLAAVGVLLNIARAPGAKLRVVSGGRSSTSKSRNSGRRNSRARGARANDRRRAAG